MLFEGYFFVDTIIIFEAGLQDHREFWLQGLSTHFKLILLQPWEPTWEKPYITNYVPCSFENWDQELERLRGQFAAQDIKAVICLNEGTVNYTVALQRALGLTLIHDLDDPRVIRNKLLMRRHLFKNGILSPRTYELDEEFDFPVIVKPSEFMASMGVSLVKNVQELKTSVELAQTVDIQEEKLRNHYGLSEDIVIEEYLEGEEFSLECWVQNGNVINVHLTKKIKVSPPFFYETGHISNAPISPALRNEIGDYVTKVVSSFSLKNGLYHFEVMIKDEAIYTIELAARPGGGMIPFLYMLTGSLDYPYILGNIMSGNSQPIVFPENLGSSAVFFPFGTNIHPDKLEEEAKSLNCKIVFRDYNIDKKNQDLSIRFGHVIFTGGYTPLLHLLEKLNKKCSHVV